MRPKPTHFLSLPLLKTDHCLKAIQETQQAMSETDTGLADMMIPMCRFHVSLGFFTIQPEYEVKFIPIITQALEEICRDCARFDILLGAVKSFPGGRVLYTAPVKRSSSLQRLKTSIDRKFNTISSSYQTVGDYSFLYCGQLGAHWEPHITLAKVKQADIKKKASRVSRSNKRPEQCDSRLSIPDACYSKVENSQFGTACFDVVQLCAMKPEHRSQIGYSVKASVLLR